MIMRFQILRIVLDDYFVLVERLSGALYNKKLRRGKLKQKKKSNLILTHDILVLRRSVNFGYSATFRLSKYNQHRWLNGVIVIILH